ncbi:MAG TPA: NAD regulator [Beijerinckiaceae bacterium]|nr:NAD regulator [Beijerinckiaceae bacterium]
MPVEVGLTAAIVAVTGEERPEPMILIVRAGSAQAEAALPAGPFDPVAHRTFEMGLRAWVNEQTGVPLGYVEQLYTFGDRGRHARAGDTDPHVVSVGYLALARGGIVLGVERAGVGLRSWYDFFPWEDWRRGRPALVDDVILPELNRWAAAEPAGAPRFGLPRAERIRALFGPGAGRFDDEMVLERFECLYEAGLASEARRDGRPGPRDLAQLGQPMQSDHRRILATAMGRLRAKMKYRPVIFELMPERFTLTALQRTAEAISGRDLHKQNFRRVVESSAVVEPTGDVSHATGGRPAALYRFRRDVVQERPAPGLRVDPVR